MHEDVLALFQRLRELGQISPRDDAMPVGLALVFLGLLIFPRAPRGDRKDNEIAVVGGGFEFCVLAEKSDLDPTQLAEDSIRENDLNRDDANGSLICHSPTRHLQ